MSVRPKGCSLKDHLHHSICIYPIVYTLNEAIRGANRMGKHRKLLTAFKNAHLKEISPKN